ncbi:MAG: hypothetical protein P8Z75_15980 [Gammaproteobacteria bacterium]|jgi:enoyl-CoA hydratase/carnithine racemase
MSKPTEQELAAALDLAKRMREQGKDSHYLAKSFLSHHYRLGYLEEVLRAVERYLNSGMSEETHRHLLKTVEKARQAEDCTARQHKDDLGLA